jgi:hypothetical protein
MLMLSMRNSCFMLLSKYMRDENSMCAQWLLHSLIIHSRC